MERRVIIVSVAAATALLADSDLDRSVLREEEDLLGTDPLEMGPPREIRLKREPEPEMPRIYFPRGERTHPTSPKQRGGRGGRW